MKKDLFLGLWGFLFLGFNAFLIVGFIVITLAEFIWGKDSFFWPEYLQYVLLRLIVIIVIAGFFIAFGRKKKTPNHQASHNL